MLVTQPLAAGIELEVPVHRDVRAKGSDGDDVDAAAQRPSEPRELCERRTLVGC